MQHFLNGENVGLVAARQSTNKDCDLVQISRHMIDNRYHFSSKGTSSEFPLYIYPNKTEQKKLGEEANNLFDDTDAPPLRKSNLDEAILQKISRGLGLGFVPEKTEGDKSTFAPIDLLDYIYAVLHSPAYREKYKEFLKIDFPRVPYPTDKSTFWQLAELGGKLRQIHLLESPVVNKLITQYPQSGDNVVTKPKFTKRDGKSVGDVYINDTQYFAGVPEVAWNFYIGGYQPAQKWLKDRQRQDA